MALNYELADAFLLIIQEEESTESIETLRNTAFAKLQNGEGKTLVSSSLNGKSFSYQVHSSATEVFAASSFAIRKYNRGLIRSTETDFSKI